MRRDERGAEHARRPDLSVELGPISLEHPLVDASGTFDLLEYARRYDGDYFADFPYAAYVPKTVTADARTGNPPPRVTETAAGMINAIGLENPGIHAWIGRLPEWAALRQPVIVSVGGNEPEQYAAVIAALEAHLAAAPAGTAPRIEGYELNISCPNVSSGLQIGADPAATAEVVGACREATGRFLLAKLTPNVRDVTEIGAAALGAGADGLSLVNTFKALVLDRADPAAVPRQPHRRPLRSGDQAHRAAHGRRGGAGVPGHAARRHGRRHDAASTRSSSSPAAPRRWRSAPPTSPPSRRRSASSRSSATSCGSTGSRRSPRRAAWRSRRAADSGPIPGGTEIGRPRSLRLQPPSPEQSLLQRRVDGKDEDEPRHLEQPQQLSLLHDEVQRL